MKTEFTLRHISSGDVFREHIQKQTQFGIAAADYINRGELVPDDVAAGIMEDALTARGRERGILLDGFPRTVAQANHLDRMLRKLGTKLDSAFYIDVPDEALIERISGRWTCRKCQVSFHSKFNPPKTAGVCDACGGELFQRDDDKPETLRERIRTFHARTGPLISHYSETRLLRRIDGRGDVESVARDISRTAWYLEETKYVRGG